MEHPEASQNPAAGPRVKTLAWFQSLPAETRASAVRRFAAKVRRPNAKGCRLWRGPPNPQGYGQLRVATTAVKAHRLALMLAGIEPGEVTEHLCHNRLCVNVDHLRPSSHAENMRSMVDAGRSSKAPRCAPMSGMTAALVIGGAILAKGERNPIQLVAKMAKLKTLKVRDVVHGRMPSVTNRLDEHVDEVLDRIVAAKLS